MIEKDNEQGNNSIVAIPPIAASNPVSATDIGPLDRVKPPTEKKRSREWER